MIFFSGNRMHAREREITCPFSLINNILKTYAQMKSLFSPFSLSLSHARFFLTDELCLSLSLSSVFQWTSNDKMHTLISNSFQDACHRSIIACAQVFDNEMSFEFLDIFHSRDKERKYCCIHTSNSLWLSNSAMISEWLIQKISHILSCTC